MFVCSDVVDEKNSETGEKASALVLPLLPQVSARPKKRQVKEYYTTMARDSGHVHVKAKVKTCQGKGQKVKGHLDEECGEQNKAEDTDVTPEWFARYMEKVDRALHIYCITQHKT